MADRSMARQTLCALKDRIATIESPGKAGGSRLPLGEAAFDRALGGGFDPAALCEIHAQETRNASAASGFTLALASLAAKRLAGALLWIGTGAGFRESGLPNAEGLQQEFGLVPEAFLLAKAHKPLDALWIAAEAAGLEALAAVVVEISGNPACLDLTATRRLQRRASASGRPVFLLRLAAEQEPTAAPLRLSVGPAPAAPRTIFGTQLPGSIDRPAFAVRLEKCRANPGGTFILEWNRHERRFQSHHRQAENPVGLVPASANRPDPAATVWPRMADRRRLG